MPDVLAWETAPDLRVFCCCYGLEGGSDDKSATRWAAQPLKKYSTILVPPAVPESGHQTVLFNSTHIVCNRGVR